MHQDFGRQRSNQNLSYGPFRNLKFDGLSTSHEHLSEICQLVQQIFDESEMCHAILDFRYFIKMCLSKSEVHTAIRNLRGDAPEAHQNSFRRERCCSWKLEEAWKLSEQSNSYAHLPLGSDGQFCIYPKICLTWNLKSKICFKNI